jgi:FHA domain
MASQSQSTIENQAAESGGEIKARLVSISIHPQLEYRLDKNTLAIGSHHSNDIVLTDTTISRRHATISRRLGRFVLTDLGSTNGSYINGRRISRPTALRRGDEIRFGSARFGFLSAGDAAAPKRSRVNPITVLAIVSVMFAAGFLAARCYLGPHPIRAARAAIKQTIVKNEAAPKASAAPESSAAPVSNPAPSTASTAANPAGEVNLSEALEAPWLKRLNLYRATAKLEPVREDTALSDGDAKHVAYLITNYGGEITRGTWPGLEMHQESSSNPGYSDEGLNAATHSDVDFVSWRGKPHDINNWNWAIDDWITGAFHRLPLMSPRFKTAGYNQKCIAGLCVAAMNAQSGVTPVRSATMNAMPVEFPPDGTVLALKWVTLETPDPTTACSGYTKQIGVPITLQLGSFIEIRLGDYALQRIDPDGTAVPIEACGFDSSTYINPDPAIEAAARATLNGFGAVVIVPKDPLEPGATYRVSLTANNKKYQWQFGVAPATR